MKNNFSFGSLFALGLMVGLSGFPVQAQLFDGPVDRLPVEERVALREGKTIVTGAEGKFVGKVLVEATSEAVWNVLTDYDNLYTFLPNVISSKVLETNGNRKIVEQVSKRKIVLVDVQSRIRTENTEIDKKQIDFRLIEGDLGKLQGSWKIEPVSDYPGGEITKVLITQEVEVLPKSGTPEGIFYDIFQGAMGDNLEAIRKEVLKRSTK